MFVCCKKNKAVVLLSSMHMSWEEVRSQVMKTKIIQYYNKTKGGVDTMDKLLGEYTEKHLIISWSLAFFYNMIQITDLALHFIYREPNTQI